MRPVFHRRRFTSPRLRTLTYRETPLLLSTGRNGAGRLGRGVSELNRQALKFETARPRTCDFVAQTSELCLSVGWRRRPSRCSQGDRHVAVEGAADVLERDAADFVREQRCALRRAAEGPAFFTLKLPRICWTERERIRPNVHGGACRARAPIRARQSRARYSATLFVATPIDSGSSSTSACRPRFSMRTP